MRTRVMSTCFLVLVLLNGVTGSILAAVFCPNIPGVMTCCSVLKIGAKRPYGLAWPNDMPIRDSVGFESAEPGSSLGCNATGIMRRIASHTLSL